LVFATPVGGLGLMIGWLMLFVAALGINRPR